MIAIRSSRPEVLCKKMLFIISQNSQENTHARVSFLTKLRTIQKEILTQLFSCELFSCETSKNNFFNFFFFACAIPYENQDKILYCSVNRKTTQYDFLNYTGTWLERKGEDLLSSFSKIGKKCPNFAKKCPSYINYVLNFSFKILFLRISKRKNPKFFPTRPFFLMLLMKYLSKCPNSKKIPLLWKIPGCSPELWNLFDIVQTW